MKMVVAVRVKLEFVQAAHGNGRVQDREADDDMGAY